LAAGEIDELDELDELYELDEEPAAVMGLASAARRAAAVSLVAAASLFDLPTTQ